MTPKEKLEIKKAERLDYLETVSAEIELMLGLNYEFKDGKFYIDTIVGDIEVIDVYKELMQDVYRFIYVYGGRLYKYGLKERIRLQKQELQKLK